jgi:hypothetical protein
MENRWHFGAESKRQSAADVCAFAIVSKIEDLVLNETPCSTISTLDTQRCGQELKCGSMASALLSHSLVPMRHGRLLPLALRLLLRQLVRYGVMDRAF